MLFLHDTASVSRPPSVVITDKRTDCIYKSEVQDNMWKLSKHTHQGCHAMSKQASGMVQSHLNSGGGEHDQERFD